MKFHKRLLSLVLTVLVLGSTLAVPALAAENDLVYGIGFVNTASLRLREEANTNCKTLGMANRDECIVVLGKDGDWYHVLYNLQEGYMHGSYLNVLTRENAELGYGKVTGSAVNLRSGPGTSYRVVDVASRNEKCYVIGLNNGWYKVIFDKNICYIRSDYLELTEIPYENKDSVNTPKFYRHGKSTGGAPSAAALNGSTNNDSESNESGSAASLTGSQIVAEAQKYLGTPYVYGGASPAGFDCSGFVYYVLKTLGYSPYRTPADQYRQGTYVSKSNLQPGDLVFFNTVGNGIGHVGIYVGDGQFIHSPNSRSVVSYASLTSGYWANCYYGARRVA